MDRLQSRLFQLIYIIVIFLCLLTKVKSLVAKDVNVSTPAPEVSCPSIDVRNKPSELNKLRNCTVIRGSLFIVLLQKFSAKDFDEYSFPNLKEITDFLLVYDVAGLTSFEKLFPNLTVIRGRRLFLNYALSIYAMKDLKVIGLHSLIAIQRGHVFIDRCPKLCYLNKINWDRMTLSPGLNHIKSDPNAPCTNICRGCSYCWSNMSCQKFQEANLKNLRKKHHCHPQCLGGCHNNTDVDCWLCQGYSDNGKCVEECPAEKLTSKDHLRCYTKKECSDLGLYVYKNECVSSCPSGYQYKKIPISNDHNITDDYRECKACPHDCPRICEGKPIYSLADSENYRGCKIVNGSVVLRIPGTVNEDELRSNLQDIREIRGFLKIFETPSITSMDMFRDLEIIRGYPPENRYFGLVIYGNKNLVKLWSFPKNVTKVIDLNGTSIFIHSNYKLCNSEIKKLMQITKHHELYNEVQYNDQEIMCDPVHLNIHVKVISHDTVTLTWKMDNTATEVRISYTEQSNGTLDFDQDQDHCERNLWITEYLLKSDLQSNETHVSYNITSLTQNTQYVCFIRIFGGKEEDSAQSKLHNFTTKPDIPVPPIVYTQNKTTNSIELAWFPAPYDYDDVNQIITHYKVDIFLQPDNQEFLDQRNYCRDPFRTVDVASELLDYDNCCNVVEFEKEEFEFTFLVDQKFRCSIDIPHSCNDVHYEMKKKRDTNNTDIPEAYKSKNYVGSVNKIPGRATSAVIPGLKYFTLYVFQFFACNDQGCGPYFLHSDRTAPDKDADIIENFSVSIVERESEKRVCEYEYYVNIVPPLDANGAVLVYTIYFRRGPEGSYFGDIKCFTRREFEKMNYQFVKLSSYKDYKISARIQSLAGPGKATEWAIPNGIFRTKVSWDWFSWLFIMLFAGFLCVLYLGVRRRIRVTNQRPIEGSSPSRMTILCSQNENDDEDILLERMQTMHVDDYSTTDEDEHQL